MRSLYYSTIIRKLLFHQYNKTGILHGTVSVKQDSSTTSSYKTAYWNFATLVLNSTLQNKTPRINVTENGQEIPGDQWPANQKLIFLADNPQKNPWRVFKLHMELW